jgi:hypothetical protein
MEAAVRRLERWRNYHEYVLPFVERALATGIHVGTRGLVYIAYHTTNAIPVAIALIAFLLADGIVGYRLIYQGKLNSSWQLHKFLIFLSFLALLLLVAFLIYWEHFGTASGMAT